LGALTTPVEMLQHDREFEQLLDLYRQRKPMRVLEIGAGHGGTLYHWLHNAQPGAFIVAIDDRHTNHGAYQGWSPGGVTSVTLHGDSADPAIVRQAQAFGPYDWVFIDADHHEPSVRADWRAYSGLAAPGAVVALHDIAESTDPTVQVAPLWRELRDRFETLELVEPGGFGIGVIFIAPEQPHG
jgi:predicted O-methyltransferase YrrM